MAKWLLIGPPASRRIDGLQRALLASGRPLARVIDYAGLLHGTDVLAEVLARDPGAIVKLESPGEAPDLHAALVRKGWELAGSPDPEPHAIEHGELAHQHHWFGGYAHLLGSLPACSQYLNPPLDLLRMADKLACQQHLIAAGVHVPPLFGAITGYDDLCQRLDAHACDSVFIKARYGSSGAGVLAFRRNRKGQQMAMGPVELVAGNGRTRVFNALRQRRYTNASEIARMVDTLAQQGAYLERWIPKPPAPGSVGAHYDVRIVALDGLPRQRVARVSRGPLTNLHLANRRAPIETWLEAKCMVQLEADVVRVAAAFPDSRLMGLDVIVRGGRNWMLEANGFGDLLPGLQWMGRTTYEDQARLSLRDLDLPGASAHV